MLSPSLQLAGAHRGCSHDSAFGAHRFPPKQIARRVGAVVRFEPFDGELSGILYERGGYKVIGVNELHPETRQRFTIAHEVGHLLLHSGKDLFLDRKFLVRARNRRSSTAEDLAEVQANAFAAELLMPRAWIRRDAGSRTVDFDDQALVQRLAKSYKVSEQAMAFRLANLGVIDLDALS